MATKTLSTFLKEPTFLHEGVVSVVAEISASAGWTLSAGDVVKLFKIPDRAVIVGGFLSRSEPGGDVTLRIRDYSDSASSTVSAGMELITSTGSGQINIGHSGKITGANYQVSLSDGVVVRHVDVELVAASASTTGPIVATLLYTMGDRP